MTRDFFRTRFAHTVLPLPPGRSLSASVDDWLATARYNCDVCTYRTSETTTTTESIRLRTFWKKWEIFVKREKCGSHPGIDRSEMTSPT
mmetsp:Transcript_9860/g.26928  ORF Transcript_9860/g.26928 Transcript_9860/m.26928 type:complete len:89 (-) Transcript_9860:89-355(-)